MYLFPTSQCEGGGKRKEKSDLVMKQLYMCMYTCRLYMIANLILFLLLLLPYRELLVVLVNIIFLYIFFFLGKCLWGQSCRFLHDGPSKMDRSRDRKLMEPPGYMGGGGGGVPPPMPPRGPPHMRGGPMYPPDYPEPPLRGHSHNFGPHGMKV